MVQLTVDWDDSTSVWVHEVPDDAFDKLVKDRGLSKPLEREAKDGKKYRTAGTRLGGLFICFFTVHT